MFNSILESANVHPKDVRLVRHKDKRATRGRTPYELWRDAGKGHLFELYQAGQGIENRKKFDSPYWAVFIVNFNNETMFAGLYRAKYRGLLEHDTPQPHIEGGIAKANSSDVWDLTLDEKLNDLIGRLFINWGDGALAWVQYANRQDKPVTELRTAFREDVFPGFMNFIEPLSRIDCLPKSWSEALQNTRGVYLLTCPKTKEQYVGSARGNQGFWGRWQNYVQTGHADNKGLKSREPSDYQVSILEVAGSSATDDDILKMEGRWQTKLQSLEMGLNRNLAGKMSK
jgi:hypothetical protein